MRLKFMAVIGFAAMVFTSVMASAAGPVQVEIKTTAGTIVAELDSDRAPISVENFLTYTKEGFYDGTVFHRVIKGFMAQGGGFDTNGREKANKRPPIKNEASNGLKNAKYSLAMARTNAPHSATSQFFINTADNNFLNLGDPRAVSSDGYAVFGKVLKGFDVVDKIEAGEPGRDGETPKNPIVIEKVTILTK
jgi:cyclophilin family peptidyl-prolyl cis-trans isomerase